VTGTIFSFCRPRTIPGSISITKAKPDQTSAPAKLYPKCQNLPPAGSDPQAISDLHHLLPLKLLRNPAMTDT
jgi:hypothetical protein